MERLVPGLRVQIGSEIVLRRAVPHVLERDLSGRATIVHLSPQLRPGETLVERLGDIPMIISNLDELTPAPLPPAVHFDTWMKQRIDLAHAEFMERTSRRLWCDWRAAATGADIAGIYGIDTGEAVS